jgi:glycosyltransferase involved in cell wall biosynthesis
MSSQLKIGIIARIDNGGLANMTFDWWKNIPEITKCLTIISDSPYQNITRFPEQIICENFPTIEQIDLFLKDIDVVIGFETPYNWNIFSMAKERGIKTVLIPMYEWTEENPPIHPDLYLCPSLMEKDIYKYYPVKSQYIQNPIDRKLFKFKQREKAHTFIFNNGHGGVGGRNGIVALLSAIPLVKSDVKFIIHSQVQIPEIKDTRVEVRLGDTKDRTELFKEGDIMIYPKMFGALSLPIWESLSCGIPVLTTNLYPFNVHLPKEWLFESEGKKPIQTALENRIIDMNFVNPQVIADKIDEWANKDITEDSKKSNEIAEQFSWENSKEKVVSCLTTLCS